MELVWPRLAEKEFATFHYSPASFLSLLRLALLLLFFLSHLSLSLSLSLSLFLFGNDNSELSIVRIGADGLWIVIGIVRILIIPEATPGGFLVNLVGSMP